MKTLTDIKELDGKKVLLRVDFNVPVKDGRVKDAQRIEAALPTINYLLKKGAKVAIISHLGKPDGKKVKELSLFQTVPVLAGLLNKKVAFISESVGPEVQRAVAGLENGSLVVLENLRFQEGEEKNEKKFAQELSAGFDFFVNDAFSASHRNHASVVAVTEFLPAYAGLQFEKEMENLEPLTEKPKKPFVVVSGGAKISDKIEILKSLIKKADVFLIGGGMANTFLAAEGYEVGKSLFEEDQLETAEEIIRMAEDAGVEVMLPDDVIVSKTISDSARPKAKELDEIEKGEIITDIGPKTIAKFSEPLKFAGTIFWNGPMGIAEHKSFAKGTEAVAKIIISQEAVSVVGGGDTISAVADLKEKFNFVSMSGGATLEYLGKGSLPGIEALEKQE